MRCLGNGSKIQRRGKSMSFMLAIPCCAGSKSRILTIAPGAAEPLEPTSHFSNSSAASMGPSCFYGDSHLQVLLRQSCGPAMTDLRSVDTQAYPPAEAYSEVIKQTLNSGILAR